MQYKERIVFAAFLMSIASLFFEQAFPVPAVALAVHGFDFLIVFLILWETALEIRDATFPRNYIRTHAFSLGYILVFCALFLYSKYVALFSALPSAAGTVSGLLRDFFLALKVFARFRRIFRIAQRFALRPAQTIAVSFALVIMVGALVLMMPFSASGGRGLGLVDAAFTAASAVCVTGLVVVDTAVDLTRAGQAVVLALIQIGGLGIMAFSFLALFALRRSVSIKDRMTVSYMIGEDDMSKLFGGLRTIVLTTFLVEGLGAAFLFARFLPSSANAEDAAFRAVFHAVSAFCNAGFALYSDSLESFRGDPAVSIAVALLIVLGGLSFSVIKDARGWIVSSLRRMVRRGAAPQPIAALNSRVVLRMTALLLTLSFCGIYLLEHEGAMASYGLGEQYLAALFQAVTLRTAGFNTIPFGHLRDATLLFMMLFMFIGGASGSTAGGIKVNSVAAMASYFVSFVRQEPTARIGSASIAADKVSKAFLIMLFGFCAVFAGVFVLSLTEDARFIDLLFESVSAFATVGLSTGVTPSLSVPGKLVVMLLMFLGRLGPLTILAALGRKGRGRHLEYPYGDLAIG